MRRPTMNAMRKIFALFSRPTPASGVNSDDHGATQRTIDDNWECALIDEAKVATDGEADSSSEDGDEGGEKVMSSITAWSHISDLLNYALSTNNSD